MIDNLVVQARTALSPEWDHGFDEAFAELVTSDPDLVQAEFDDLMAASWPGRSGPAQPPEPPAPTARSAPPPGTSSSEPTVARPDEEATGHVTDDRHPPP
jgi:hypothetical protein